MRRKPPLLLNGRANGLDAARAALKAPPRPHLPAWVALLCAALMAALALAVAAVVVLGGWEPSGEPKAATVRGVLSSR